MQNTMDGSPVSGESLEDLLVSEWSPETQPEMTSASEELCSLSVLGSAGAGAELVFSMLQFPGMGMC